MGKRKLTDAEIDKILSDITIVSTEENDDFDVPDQLQKDSEESVKDKLDGQLPSHRKILLGLIIALTVASFLLLASIIIFQMWKRLSYPEYNGVSDGVVKILATGVFAELVGVIGIIVRFVWQNPK